MLHRIIGLSLAVALCAFNAQGAAATFDLVSPRIADYAINRAADLLSWNVTNRLKENQPKRDP